MTEETLPRSTRLLAISGSLRSGSSNTALVSATARLALPPRLLVTIYEGLGALPAFNPDVERAGITDDSLIPMPVMEWRTALRDADAVVLSTPEYAHGLPGVLKNALDWVVGSGELVDKPVALFNASARSTYAQASLMETLTVMSARLVPGAMVTLPPGPPLDAAGIVADPALVALIQGALEQLTKATRGGA